MLYLLLLCFLMAKMLFPYLSIILYFCSSNNITDMTKNISYSIFSIMIALCFMSACRSNTENISAIDLTVPVPPDYADTTQWYVFDRQAPVDLFYIVSTETGDYTINGRTWHYADTRNDSIRRLLFGEMQGVDQLLSGSLNYFSPYYRQCTLQTFTSDSLVSDRILIPLADVRKAFAHYLAHFNQGRPFILAGFSQGGIAVVDLLKQMDTATRSRMVAAYVIGWHVAEADLAHTSNILPAQDSADLGVTVCYNSVRDNSCAIPMISEGNKVAINPFNWQTDATPATLISPISADTLTITLDTSTLLLQVQGYRGTDYIIPLIGREGNYHGLEISLYAPSLRRNMALRADRFLALRSQ